MQMIKKTVCGAFFVLCAAFASAQEDAIALPDVTTVVSGGALTAGKDSVPDYSPITPTTETARVDLPQVADVPDAPAPAPVVTDDETAFRLGGGIATLFPLGSDVLAYKLGFAGVWELPFWRTIVRELEWGASAHVFLGGCAGKDDYAGGFDGELSAGVYLRIPMSDVIFLQPSVEFGFSLINADTTTCFDPQFLFACSARFVPPQIADGALDFAVTPVFQLMPISDNAVCTLGIRLGAVYSFRK